MNQRHAELYRLLWARVDSTLSDGEWHDYERLVREVGKLIPPGIAMRAQKQARRAQKLQRDGWSAPARRVQAIDTDRAVESGRRTIVRVMLKNPRFEFDRPAGLKPGLPPRHVRLVDPARARLGGCPANPEGHLDVQLVGKRGARYWVCERCGRTQRASQHPGREQA